MTHRIPALGRCRQDDQELEVLQRSSCLHRTGAVTDHRHAPPCPASGFILFYWFLFLYSFPKYSLPTSCLLPVGPRAGNPLGSHLADKETITGTSNILLSWGCILDGLGNNEKKEQWVYQQKNPTLYKNITEKGKVRHLRETNVASTVCL